MPGSWSIRTPVGCELLAVYSVVVSLGRQLVDLCETPGLREDVCEDLGASARRLEETETMLARAIVRELSVGAEIPAEEVLR